MTSEIKEVELPNFAPTIARKSDQRAQDSEEKVSDKLEGGSIDSPESPELPFVDRNDLPTSIIVRAKLKPNYCYLHFYALVLGVGVW